MKSVSIFRGTTGLNTRLDPVRLRFDPEAGISDLAACADCVVDDTGRISRRDGFTATTRTEAWRSLFSCGQYALGIKGGALSVIEPDMTYTSIRNVNADAKMSYFRDTDGVRDVIYYCNGYEKGRVIDKISYSWPVSKYVGPETRKEFYESPIGHLLEIRNSRMFIAENNILWYSEPGAYSLYRLASNYFGFSSRLKMIQAVLEGLWVSDSESIYFLSGAIIPSRSEMPKQIKMADYSVIEGTPVKVSGNRVGEGMPGIVIIFTTTEGICVGTGNGQLINTTEKKLTMPGGLTGTGLYKDGHYTVTIN